ncbi:pyruvate, water dikinase regulatory protein [Kineococcus sp. LSe6-4]|uniref:Putative phosphoenolpyruvate synthase regulatory protein n=1 Tax=Kineococcus halophytocola TaxID=3234027 RepID=A0ABV4H0S7_9ACTN
MSDAAPARAVFFVSDSTGITAETLGGALLSNFPAVRFARRTTPFVASRAAAEQVVRDVVGAAGRGLAPILFTTIRDPVVREVLRSAPAVRIDLLSGYLTELEQALGTTASEQLSGFHRVGDTEAYFARMRAVEYAIEHDDGQSYRALGSADVVIVAPSRCGKTPTTMYLALQHGLQVANYPLTDEDFPADGLPTVLAPLADRCFGLTTTALRLSQVRHERRPDSRYASLAQCSLELRRAEQLYRRHRIPYVNSSTKSVEEMSAVILQNLHLRPRRTGEKS